MNTKDNMFRDWTLGNMYFQGRVHGQPGPRGRPGKRASCAVLYYSENSATFS